MENRWKLFSHHIVFPENLPLENEEIVTTDLVQNEIAKYLTVSMTLNPIKTFLSAHNEMPIFCYHKPEK